MKLKLILLVLLFTTFKSVASIKIFTGNGDGTDWNDGLNWTGASVPNAADSVYIENHSVEVSGISSARWVFLEGDLTVANGASLSIINGAFNHYSSWSGTLAIYGELFLVNCSMVTYSSTKLIVKSGGTLSISGSITHALYSGGDTKVNIGGELFIINTFAHGIYSVGDFVNNGKIIIDGADKGIYQSNSSPVANNFTNNQIIEIMNCASYGIDIRGGVFNNYDMITINQTASECLYIQVEVGTPGQFNNYAGGRLYAYGGINNVQDFLNDGYVFCSRNDGVSLKSGRFINNDSLVISASGYGGISFSETFINNSTGVVLSDSVNDMGMPNLFFASNSGIVENYGKMIFQLDGLYNGLESSGGTNATFNNHQDLFIRKPKETGIEVNNKKLHNFPTGKIIIDSTYSYVAYKGYNDTLINEGQFIIRNNIAAGGMLRTGRDNYFFNNGELKLENTNSGSAIDNVYGLIENDTSGVIDIVHSGSDHALISGNKFVNKGLLKIHAENDGKALSIESRFGSNNPELFNYGNLLISTANRDTAGIYVEGYFYNDTCATVKSEAPFYVADGDTLQNYGFISIRSDSGLNDTGVKENYGIIESFTGNYSSLFSVNDGIILSPWYHSVSQNFTYHSEIQNRNGYFDMSSSFFGDAAYSSVVGTYSTGSNTAIIISDAQIDTLYVPISLKNKCTFHVKIPIMAGSMPYCSALNNNSFVGNVSDNWFQPSNWSLNQVPSYCTNAIIPNAQNAEILPNHHAEANKLIIETGAVFEAHSGSVLEVRNDL